MIQIVLLILGMMTVSVGLYETNHFWFEYNQSQNLAQETASAWNGFAQGLTAYVQQNMGTITGSEPVSCQTLQSAGYYSGSCTDPVGETMEGVVAAPYGFPQSWGVIAISAPSPAILGKFGIGNANANNAVQQSLQWHSFLYDVATILQGDNVTAAVYNGGSQTFKMPFGTATSSYANYSLPATPTTYGQSYTQSIDGQEITMGPDGLMAFPQLHKEPGYWLWQVQLLDESDGEASISFLNYGYSAVCPPGGVTPVSWNSPWVIDNVTQSYAMYEQPGTFVYNDPSETTNYHQVFVCVPAPQSLVNNATSYNPFNSFSDNLPDTTTNIDPDNSNYWDGDPPSPPYGSYGQAGMAYYLSVGSNTYALDVYAGIQGVAYPGSGGTFTLNSLVFYQLTASEVSNHDAINYAPSIWLSGGNDCSAGYCMPPTVALPLTSIALS